jgi:hypothetical protein
MKPRLQQQLSKGLHGSLHRKSNNPAATDSAAGELQSQTHLALQQLSLKQPADQRKPAPGDQLLRGAAAAPEGTSAQQ